MPKLYVSDSSSRPRQARQSARQEHPAGGLPPSDGRGRNLIGCEVLKNVAHSQKRRCRLPQELGRRRARPAATFVAVLRAGLGLVPGLWSSLRKPSIGHNRSLSR